MAAREKYLIRVGLNYPPHDKPPHRRAEPGDIVDDLPEPAKAFLVATGAVEGPLSKERLKELKAAAGEHGPDLGLTEDGEH